MGFLGYLMRNCNSKERLDGKVAVITGCNTGIGFETAKNLALRGCRVVMACRDLEKACIAAEEIKQVVRERREKNNRKVKKDAVNNDIMSNGENEDSIVAVYHLDLSSLKSVRKCAETILQAEPKINLLINNAGVMACPRKLTEDGYEWQFAVNHLGHFLFTLLLLERICESPGARIVNLSSLAHFWGVINFDDLNLERRYSPTGAYFRSKLANLLFTKDLAKRLKGTGVTTYAVHPGIVATEMSRHFSNTLIPGMTWVCQKLGPYFAQNSAQGCQTTLYCALDERAANENGLYYRAEIRILQLPSGKIETKPMHSPNYVWLYFHSNCKPTTPSEKAKDPELARRLWDVSLKLVGIEEDPSRNLTRQVENKTITRM